MAVPLRAAGSGERKHYWSGLLYLVVNATYEMPLAFRSNQSDERRTAAGVAAARSDAGSPPPLLQRCRRMSADKGYDARKLIDRLWQRHQIRRFVAVRN